MHATTLTPDTAGPTDQTEMREASWMVRWQQVSTDSAFSTRGIHTSWNGPIPMLLLWSSHWDEHILYTMYLLHCTHDLLADRLNEPCLAGVSSSTGYTLRVHRRVAGIERKVHQLLLSHRSRLTPSTTSRRRISFSCHLIHPKRMRKHSTSPLTPSSNQLDSAVRWPSGLRR